MTYKGIKGSYALTKMISCGGEGFIYEVSGCSDIVAKIYKKEKLSGSSGRRLANKIKTMLAQPVDPYINKVLVVAWPQDILFDLNGGFAGFIMPRVNTKHHISAARREIEREKLFPNYSWETAITVAYNLAVAVDCIHKTGAVIGDFNSNNIMIDRKAHVTLIDADSYTITSKKTGRTYKCGVGVPEVLAPELQGRNLSLSTRVFTKESDRFSLAIHIFMLLMDNYHPFGCLVPDDRSSFTLSPASKNISRGLCPYVRNIQSVSVPKGAPDFKALPVYIQNLFKRAFDYDVNTAIKRETIARRPTAAEWKKALRSFLSSFSGSERNIAKSKHVPQGNIREDPRVSANSIPVLFLLSMSAGGASGPMLALMAKSVLTEMTGYQFSLRVLGVVLAGTGIIFGCMTAEIASIHYRKNGRISTWVMASPLAMFANALAISIVLLLIWMIISLIPVISAIVNDLWVVLAVGAFIAGLFSS